MIPLDACRKALGPGVELSDGELEKLRADLYWLAEGAVDMLIDAERRKRRKRAHLELVEERGR